MTDIEAREAQIVENLQRADVHPIDEAFAYRELIEHSKPRLELATIAAKVGKSENSSLSRQDV
jgi:ParB family chromosome partitioning protein